MPVDQKDVLRVHDTPANLSANLKEEMFGWDTTNNRLGVKLAGGSMKFTSDDTQQVLIAGTQSITGAKTFDQNIKTVVGKLLSLDDIAGFRLNTTSTHTISDDDSLYRIDQLLGIYGGDAEILDHGDTQGENFLASGDFSSGTPWSFVFDMSIVANELSYTHSSGAGNGEQLVADFILRAFENEWYEFTYDVVTNTSDATVTITTDTGDVAVSLNMDVGPSKIAHVKLKSGLLKFKISATSTSGSFTMDNFSFARLGGTLQVKEIGPGGSVKISGMGDIESSDGTILNAFSGWFGAIAAGTDKAGLQFNSLGAGRFSKTLDIGWGGDLNFDTAATTQRFAFEKIQSGQTVGAASVNLDFQILQLNGLCSAFLIWLRALRDDGTEGFGALAFATFRRNGGTLSIVGTEVNIAQNDDFSGALSFVITTSGDNIRITPTGEAGKTINWTAELIGLGNNFGSRDVP